MSLRFKIFILAILIVSLAMIGCNRDKASDTSNTTQIPLDVNYSGQHLGCMETYNPLFCPEIYKPPIGLKGLNYVK